MAVNPEELNKPGRVPKPGPAPRVGAAQGPAGAYDPNAAARSYGVAQGGPQRVVGSSARVPIGGDPRRTEPVPTALPYTKESVRPSTPAKTTSAPAPAPAPAPSPAVVPRAAVDNGRRGPTDADVIGQANGRDITRGAANAAMGRMNTFSAGVVNGKNPNLYTPPAGNDAPQAGFRDRSGSTERERKALDKRIADQIDALGPLNMRSKRELAGQLLGLRRNVLADRMGQLSEADKLVTGAEAANADLRDKSAARRQQSEMFAERMGVDKDQFDRRLKQDEDQFTRAQNTAVDLEGMRSRQIVTATDGTAYRVGANGNAAKVVGPDNKPLRLPVGRGKDSSGGNVTSLLKDAAKGDLTRPELLAAYGDAAVVDPRVANNPLVASTEANFTRAVGSAISNPGVFEWLSGFQTPQFVNDVRANSETMPGDMEFREAQWSPSSFANWFRSRDNETYEGRLPGGSWRTLEPDETGMTFDQAVAASTGAKRLQASRALEAAEQEKRRKVGQKREDRGEH